MTDPDPDPDPDLERLAADLAAVRDDEPAESEFGPRLYWPEPDEPSDPER